MSSTRKQDASPPPEAGGPGTGEGAAVVRCEGVGKRFGTSWVLRGVDVVIAPGEVVGLIGPGGHGKSVLLKMFAGLLSPDEGNVVVAGQDLATANARELAAARQRMGYLFQNYALFDFMTVRENVAFPLRQQGGFEDDEIERRVREILDYMGLAHALDLYPNELSGGMKKRVGVGRAVIAEPPFLLYDDPTAGLDPVTSSKIFRLVAQLHAKINGATSIVVSHDIDRMKVICDRYLMIHEGRLVFDGAESEIGTADPIVSEFFYGAVNKASGVV